MRIVLKIMVSATIIFRLTLLIFERNQLVSSASSPKAIRASWIFSFTIRCVALSQDSTADKLIRSGNFDAPRESLINSEILLAYSVRLM